MFNTFPLSDRQAMSYLVIGSQPDTTRGGPSNAQVRAMGKLPREDRWPVLSEFGNTALATIPSAALAPLSIWQI